MSGTNADHDRDSAVVPLWAGRATLPVALLAACLVATVTVSAVAPPDVMNSYQLPCLDNELGQLSEQTIHVPRGGDLPGCPYSGLPAS
jgi:hypothetical protein